MKITFKELPLKTIYAEYAQQIIIGFVLGTFALMMLSFTVFINRATLLNKQIQEHQDGLFKKAETMCGTYPEEVSLANGVIRVRCGSVER